MVSHLVSIIDALHGRGGARIIYFMESMVYKDSAWPTSLSASKDTGPRFVDVSFLFFLYIKYYI
jgi:hypothetical protein